MHLGGCITESMIFTDADANAAANADADADSDEDISSKPKSGSLKHELRKRVQKMLQVCCIA